MTKVMISYGVWLPAGLMNPFWYPLIYSDTFKLTLLLCIKLWIQWKHVLNYATNLSHFTKLLWNRTSELVLAFGYFQWLLSCLVNHLKFTTIKPLIMDSVVSRRTPEGPTSVLPWTNSEMSQHRLQRDSLKTSAKSWGQLVSRQLAGLSVTQYCLQARTGRSVMTSRHACGICTSVCKVVKRERSCTVLLA